MLSWQNLGIEKAGFAAGNTLPVLIVDYGTAMDACIIAGAQFPGPGRSIVTTHVQSERLVKRNEDMAGRAIK
jgi:hypothetical protein